MNATGIVILLVLVVLALAAVALILAAKRRARSEQLKGRFGPEYDRAIERHGERKKAETHLSDVVDRREALDIKDLSPERREGFSQRWVAIQTAFVDRPAGAVRDADDLVAELMRERGYPVDDFETKLDMVAADHPQVAEHYRAAHAIAARGRDRGGEGRTESAAGARSDTGTAARTETTEDSRQAFVHFRALFAVLLDDGDHGRHSGPEDLSRPAKRPADLTDRAVDLTDRDRADARPEQG
jgi:hypothetical protein